MDYEHDHHGKPLPRVTISNPPFPIEFLFYRSSLKSPRGTARYVMKLMANVPCSRTGKPGGFQKDVTVEVSLANRITPKKVAVWARELLADWLSHEAAEWILVDGVRPIDPHAKRKRKSR